MGRNFLYIREGRFNAPISGEMWTILKSLRVDESFSARLKQRRSVISIEIPARTSSGLGLSGWYAIFSPRVQISRGFSPAEEV